MCAIRGDGRWSGTSDATTGHFLGLPPSRRKLSSRWIRIMAASKDCIRRYARRIQVTFFHCALTLKINHQPWDGAAANESRWKKEACQILCYASESFITWSLATTFRSARSPIGFPVSGEKLSLNFHRRKTPWSKRYCKTNGISTPITRLLSWIRHWPDTSKYDIESFCLPVNEHFCMLFPRILNGHKS